MTPASASPNNPGSRLPRSPVLPATFFDLVAAVVLSAGFSWYGFRLWRNYSDALARKTFRFSLIHLSVLFAALLVDHYLV